MEPRIRYCVELDKIRHLPDHQRVRAETRFLLLKECEDVFLEEEAKTLGDQFRRYKAVQRYCSLKNVPERTFYNWLRAYRTHGIEGLIPLYGSQSWECGSMVFIDEGVKRHKNNQPKRTISVRLDIQTDRPLQCLAQLQELIATNPLISPDKKASFTRALKRICDLSKQKSPMGLSSPLTEEEKHRLERYRAGNHKKHSAKATAILMMNEGGTMLDIGMATNTQETTLYKWLRGFNKKRLAFVETRVSDPTWIEARDLRKTRVIDIIHKQPSLFGINRTSWTYKTIVRAYRETYNLNISTSTLQHIIKSTGFTWRRARKVWTSPDPLYREKIDKVLEALQNLKEKERFFFIDEAGPYQVKKYGGQALTPIEERREVPEYQSSKGSVQLIAALEAKTNQVTWRFIRSKSMQNIITMLEQLTSIYADFSRLVVTWDSISSHSGHELTSWITAHNEAVSSAGSGPVIEVVPLPSRSQFLNVIESVFSGMKRAVIANSDYGSKREMEEAISRHFEERNRYYKENPKRAGNKIWDREAFDLEKLPGGLFKRM